MKKSNFILCFILVLALQALHASAPPEKTSKPLALKKITVTQTNNLFYTDRYKYLYLPKGPSDPEMRKLHDYVARQINVRSLSEPDVFYALMEWTCLRWEHDAIHEPPPGSSSLQILQLAEKGQKFRCQEYAQVFHDVLISFGYVSRLLQMRKPDAAYAGPGAGHVAVEVYCNTLAKWVYLDPQWCTYVVRDSVPLSFYEMYQVKTSLGFDSLKFQTSGAVLAREDGEKKTEYITEYRDFLRQYFGYEGIIANRFGGIVFLFLPLEATEQYFTFQGVPVNRRVFTNQANNLYFKVNSTVILFDYDKEANWGEIFSKYDIKTPEDYVSNMPKFAARPDFTLQFQNNMPWFDHYEIKLDNGKWKRVKGEKYTWNLIEGMNDIHVRSVNVAGISGNETFATLRYGSDISSR